MFLEEPQVAGGYISFLAMLPRVLSSRSPSALRQMGVSEPMDLSWKYRGAELQRRSASSPVFSTQ